MTVAVVRRASTRLTTWIDGEGSMRAVEMLRIAAGPIVIAHLWPFLADAAAGVVYSDRFYAPYATWYPEVPRGLYLVLLWLAVPAAIAMTAGLATRVVSAYSALFVGYNLFLSRLHFSNNRAFLLVLLVGITLLPLGRVWSLDEWIRRARRRHPRPAFGPLWPVLLMRFEAASVYLASGTSKLLDPDWWGGTVTRLRVEQWHSTAELRGVPSSVLDFLAGQGFHFWFAKMVILTELFIGIGLITRRSRTAALWVAVWFHVIIEIVASVQVFSVAALAALFIWVTPEEGGRTLTVDRGVRIGRATTRLVDWLDWTRRFHVDVAAGGSVLAVTDRSGRTVRDAEALLATLTRLPPLFPFVAPFHLPGLRRLWNRALGRGFP